MMSQASAFNPSMVSGRYAVLALERLAQDTYRLELAAPDMARLIRPGQFLMLRMPDRTDPLLGRAFALYDTGLDAHGQPNSVAIVFAVIGKMTKLMAALSAGDWVEAWGPLGQPFPDYSGTEHLVAIGGGIGQTPMLALLKRVLGLKGYGGLPARREAAAASIYYGVRSAAFLAGLDDFAATGAAVHLATDDGSTGFHGFVTQLLETHHQTNPWPTPVRWVGCGPEPMMHALAALAERCGIPLDLSLETPMACGVGICFSCVTKVHTDAGWDYRRVCVEGPIFAADRLAW